MSRLSQDKSSCVNSEQLLGEVAGKVQTILERQSELLNRFESLESRVRHLESHKLMLVGAILLITFFSPSINKFVETLLK